MCYGWVSHMAPFQFPWKPCSPCPQFPSRNNFCYLNRGTNQVIYEVICNITWISLISLLSSNFKPWYFELEMPFSLVMLYILWMFAHILNFFFVKDEFFQYIINLHGLPSYLFFPLFTCPIILDCLVSILYFQFPKINHVP